MLPLLFLLLLVGPPPAAVPQAGGRSAAPLLLAAAAAAAPTHPPRSDVQAADPSQQHQQQQHAQRLSAVRPGQQSRRVVLGQRQEQGHRNQQEEQRQQPEEEEEEQDEQQPTSQQRQQHAHASVPAARLPPECGRYAALWADGSPAADDVGWWRHVGVTQRMTEAAVAAHAAWPNRTRNALYFAFVGGRAHVLPTDLVSPRFRTHAPLMAAYIKMLLHLEERYGVGSSSSGSSSNDGSSSSSYIPDVDFVITTEDMAPVTPRQTAEVMHERGRAPQLRYGKLANVSTDLLLPNFHFGLKRYDSELLAAVADINSRHPWPDKRPIAFGRFSNYARRRPPRGQPPVLGAGGRVVCGGGDVGDCFVREHLVEWAAQFRPPESEQQQQQQQRQQRQQEQQAGSEHPERGLQEGSVSGFGGGSSGSSSAEGSSRNRSRSRRSKGASAGAGQQRRQQRELLARKRDRRQASSSASSPSPSSSSSSQPSPSTQPWHVDVSLHGRLSMADHAAYRWLLHLDGVALSSRLEQLLALGSLVVREETGYAGFYHHLLRPGGPRAERREEEEREAEEREQGEEQEQQESGQHGQRLRGAGSSAAGGGSGSGDSRRHAAAGRRRRPLIAYSCGSYGAYLADGSEFQGDYADSVSTDALIEFHRARLDPVRSRHEIDLIAFETVPCLKEAEAIVELLRRERYCKPAWISFSCKDDAHTCHGEDFGAQCVPLLAAAAAEGLVAAAGVNCTPPRHVPALLAAARQQLQQLEVSAAAPPPPSPPADGMRQQQQHLACAPRRLLLLCYPNSGEQWDGAGRCWHSAPDDIAEPGRFAAAAADWVGSRAMAVSLVGGCCRTGPAHIAALRRRLVAPPEDRAAAAAAAPALQ